MGYPLSVLVNPVVAYEGQLADSDNNVSKISRLAGGTILPGRFVCFHSGDPDGKVELPVSTGEVTAQSAGITIYDAMFSSFTGTGGPGNPYLVNDMMPVLRRGRIWVTVEEAVTAFVSPVFVRFTANAGTTAIGRFRTSADTARAVQLPGAQFLTSQSTIDGLALLEVNLPL